MHTHHKLSQHSKPSVAFLDEAISLKFSAVKVSTDPGESTGRAQPTEDLTIEIKRLTPKPLLMHENGYNPNLVKNKCFQITTIECSSGLPSVEKTVIFIASTFSKKAIFFQRDSLFSI